MTFEDELKEAKEKRRLIYRAPLPVKKQRVSQYRYERNGKPKIYTREEIRNYELTSAVTN